MTKPIHQDLQQDDLLPTYHLLDSGYITAHLLATSQQTFGVELIGPEKVNVQWQAITPQGIDKSQFQIDWDHQQAVCPEGQTSISWTLTKDSRQHEVIKIRFSTTDCQKCPRLALCTHSKSKYPRRLLSEGDGTRHLSQLVTLEIEVSPQVIECPSATTARGEASGTSSSTYPRVHHAVCSTRGH